MHHTEKPLDSQTLFEGQVIRLTLDTVELENGHEATREVVHHNGGAGIVALDGKGRVALVRQYRYAHGAELLEIPAGKVEKGEPPVETARRELAEEAGRVAESLVPFGTVIPTPGYCTEVIHIYLATGLSQVPQQLDPDEFLDVLWLPLDQAVQKVLDGEITDSKSVSGLLRAQKWLENMPKNK